LKGKSGKRNAEKWEPSASLLLVSIAHHISQGSDLAS